MSTVRIHSIGFFATCRTLGVGVGVGGGNGGASRRAPARHSLRGQTCRMHHTSAVPLLFPNPPPHLLERLA